MKSFLRKIEKDITDSMLSNIKSKLPYKIFIAFIMYSYITGPFYSKFFKNDEIKDSFKRIESIKKLK